MSNTKYSAAATSEAPAKKGCVENCTSGTAHFCHRVGIEGPEEGQDIYCSQTCSGWGKILGCYGLLYILCFLMTWGLLQSVVEFGLTSLWVMFAVFAVCLVAAVAGALYGQVKRGNEDEGIVARG